MPRADDEEEQEQEAVVAGAKEGEALCASMWLLRLLLSIACLQEMKFEAADPHGPPPPPPPPPLLLFLSIFVFFFLFPVYYRCCCCWCAFTKALLGYLSRPSPPTPSRLVYVWSFVVSSCELDWKIYSFFFARYVAASRRVDLTQLSLRVGPVLSDLCPCL